MSYNTRTVDSNDCIEGTNFRKEDVERINNIADKLYTLKCTNNDYEQEEKKLKDAFCRFVNNLVHDSSYSGRGSGSYYLRYGADLCDAFFDLTKDKDKGNLLMKNFDPAKATSTGFFGYLINSLNRKVKSNKSKLKEKGLNSFQEKILSSLIKRCEEYKIDINNLSAKELESIINELHNELGYSKNAIREVWEINHKSDYISFEHVTESIYGEEDSYYDKDSDNIDKHHTYDTAYSPKNSSNQDAPTCYKKVLKSFDIALISELKDKDTGWKYFPRLFTSAFINDPCFQNVWDTIRTSEYRKYGNPINNSKIDYSNKTPAYTDILRSDECWNMLKGDLEEYRTVLIDEEGVNAPKILHRYGFTYVIDNRKKYNNESIAEEIGVSTPAVSKYKKEKYKVLLDDIKKRIQESLLR